MLRLVRFCNDAPYDGGQVLGTKPVPRKVAVFRQSIVSKKIIFPLDYTSSHRSTKNNVERDWVGSIEHTSYRLGRCNNTEEPRVVSGPPLFSPCGKQL